MKSQEVILCYPVNYSLKEGKINKDLMFNQYNELLNFLSEKNVKMYFLPPIYGSSQVYTQDIAFKIGKKMFVGKMKRENRKKEYKAIEEYIKINELETYYMKNFIEGGDVVIIDNKIFVGLSKRTELKAVEELREVLNKEEEKYEIFPINFDKEKFVHLDCVFNIINKESCVLSDYVYDKKEIKEIFKNIYYMNGEAALDLGINFIIIEGIIVTSNKIAYEYLKNKGFEVKYIDFSEFVMGRGSFNCVTLFTTQL